MIDGTEKPKIPLFELCQTRSAIQRIWLSRGFGGYSKLIFLFFMLHHFMLPGNFYYGSEIRHGIFWGINFGPAIFWGFDSYPHSIIPVT